MKTYSATMTQVPVSKARPMERRVSCSSSEMYDAAFHPLYENMMRISASSQFDGCTEMPAEWKCDHEPDPKANPRIQKTTMTARIKKASAFCVSLPAPKLHACRSAKRTMKK